MSKEFEYLKAYYAGKRVLVTGHSGFKGSWLALWLHELGAEVIGYSRDDNENTALFESLGVKDIATSISGDVLDLVTFRKVVEKHRPHIVFHLAAQSLVRDSYRNPKETIEVNVMGTVNVMDVVRTTDCVEALLVITSDKCYHNTGSSWAYRECDPLGGNDPYSASKACAELVVNAYLSSFFKARPSLRVASVRAGNVIGGGDWAIDRLIPDCIRALTQKQEIVLRNPLSTRPWQHVFEPLSGYLFLAALLGIQGKEFEGAWNFGPSKIEDITVEQIVELVCHDWGNGSYRVEKDASMPEANALAVDSSKALRRLGWSAAWNTQRALKETVSWYKKNWGVLDTEMVRDYSSKQIAAYMESVSWRL